MCQQVVQTVGETRHSAFVGTSISLTSLRPWFGWEGEGGGTCQRVNEKTVMEAYSDSHRHSCDTKSFICVSSLVASLSVCCSERCRELYATQLHSLDSLLYSFTLRALVSCLLCVCTPPACVGAYAGQTARPLSAPVASPCVCSLCCIVVAFCESESEMISADLASRPLCDSGLRFADRDDDDDDDEANSSAFSLCADMFVWKPSGYICQVVYAANSPGWTHHGPHTHHTHTHLRGAW